MREKTALTSDLTMKVAQQTKDGHMGVLPVLLIDTLMAVQSWQIADGIFKTVGES